MESYSEAGKVQVGKPGAGSGTMIWTEGVEVHSEEFSPAQR